MSENNSEINKRHLPSPEEIEAMVAFPHDPTHDSECSVLCDDLRQTVEELDAAKATVAQLVIRLQNINRRMKALHCALCLPE